MWAKNVGNSFKSAHFIIESRLAEAEAGNADALYDLRFVDKLAHAQAD